MGGDSSFMLTTQDRTPAENPEIFARKIGPASPYTHRTHLIPHCLTSFSSDILNVVCRESFFHHVKNYLRRFMKSWRQSRDQPISVHRNPEAEAKDAARKRTPTPKPSEFAISLAAYIQTIIRTCPFCGHEEEEQISNEEENDSNSADPVHVNFGLTFVTLSIADPEIYR
jgi:hypothetical protein